MNLLEDIPKEIKPEEFGKFLEVIEKEFPANEFPELFVHYQTNNYQIIVLAVGSSNECAEQVVQVFKKYRTYAVTPRLSLRRRVCSGSNTRCPLDNRGLKTAILRKS